MIGGPGIVIGVVDPGPGLVIVRVIVGGWASMSECHGSMGLGTVLTPPSRVTVTGGATWLQLR